MNNDEKLLNDTIKVCAHEICMLMSENFISSTKKYALKENGETKKFLEFADTIKDGNLTKELNEHLKKAYYTFNNVLLDYNITNKEQIENYVKVFQDEIERFFEFYFGIFEVDYKKYKSKLVENI